MKNARLIRVSEELMLSLFRNGDVTAAMRNVRCQKGLPDDARIVSAECVPGQHIDLWVESELFAETDHPFITPEYTLTDAP